MPLSKQEDFPGNPLGRKIFSKGKEEFNFSLQPGESVPFRYRIIVQSAETVTKDDMNKLSIGFEKVR